MHSRIFRQPPRKVQEFLAYIRVFLGHFVPEIRKAGAAQPRQASLVPLCPRKRGFHRRFLNTVSKAAPPRPKAANARRELPLHFAACKAGYTAAAFEEQRNGAGIFQILPDNAKALCKTGRPVRRTGVKASTRRLPAPLRHTAIVAFPSGARRPVLRTAPVFIALPRIPCRGPL